MAASSCAAAGVDQRLARRRGRGSRAAAVSLWQKIHDNDPFQKAARRRGGRLWLQHRFYGDQAGRGGGARGQAVSAGPDARGGLDLGPGRRSGRAGGGVNPGAAGGSARGERPCSGQGAASSASAALFGCSTAATVGPRGRTSPPRQGERPRRRARGQRRPDGGERQSEQKGRVRGPAQRRCRNARIMEPDPAPGLRLKQGHTGCVCAQGRVLTSR